MLKSGDKVLHIEEKVVGTVVAVGRRRVLGSDILVKWSNGVVRKHNGYYLKRLAK